MADSMGNTPENRRYADPYTDMTAAFAAPLPPGGPCDDDPHPQITVAQYESGAGTPEPLRPVRAIQHQREFAHPSDILFGYIEPPCG